MILTLTSHQLKPHHADLLKSLFSKKPGEVNLIYVTTPTNDRPQRPDWSRETESFLKKIFPRLKPFDFESTYKQDPDFNFPAFLAEQDYIFFSGGNAYLISYWVKKTGARGALIELIRKNQIIYGGESAGALYAYKELETYSPLDGAGESTRKGIRRPGARRFRDNSSLGRREISLRTGENRQGLSEPGRENCPP